MTSKTLTTGRALAVLATASLAIAQPAMAKPHGAKTAKVRLVPSQQKPSYHGIAKGGPMMLIDIPQVPAGGGVLNAGLLPSTGVFKGVPLLGDFGL